MAGNSNLASAMEAKQDEFYTQLRTIEDELRHYRKHFKGKTVLCNCDDPFESNFFKYFALNFNKLGLKKLIATCYAGSSITGTQLSLFGSDTRTFRDARGPHKAMGERRADDRRELPDALPRLQPQKKRRLAFRQSGQGCGAAAEEIGTISVALTRWTTR